MYMAPSLLLLATDIQARANPYVTLSSIINMDVALTLCFFLFKDFLFCTKNESVV